MQRLREQVEERLRAAGFDRVEYLSHASNDANFGDASVIFRVDTLLFRVVRDRGQEFLDVTSSGLFRTFYQYDDVEIALGWKTVDQVLNKKSPEDLLPILKRIAEHFDELRKAFSGKCRDATIKSVEDAARVRGQRFVERLTAKGSGLEL